VRRALAGLWRRYRALERERRFLVLEAAVLLAVSWCGVRMLSFAMLRRLLNAYSERLPSRSAMPAALIGWAVTAAGGVLPQRRACLLEALAADAMLRRHGHDPTLELGIRSGTNRAGPLEGHAWVTCEGGIVVGDLETLPEYVSMSAPPPGSAHSISPAPLRQG
jgi:Transglutaminase-like superfamily